MRWSRLMAVDDGEAGSMSLRLRCASVARINSKGTAGRELVSNKLRMRTGRVEAPVSRTVAASAQALSDLDEPVL